MAPKRPPRVKMDVTTENWVVFMGMHRGSEAGKADVCRLLFLQVRTSWGALSSA